MHKIVLSEFRAGVRDFIGERHEITIKTLPKSIDEYLVNLVEEKYPTLKIIKVNSDVYTKIMFTNDSSRIINVFIDY